MAKRKVRTIVVVILLILTVALAAGAIYLSYWIKKNNEGAKPSQAANGTWKINRATNITCNGTSCTLNTMEATSCVSGMVGYVFNCPDGLSSSTGVCKQNPTKIGEGYSRGQTIDISGYLSGKCGAVQFDWNRPQDAADSGFCAAMTLTYTGTCGDTDTTKPPVVIGGTNNCPTYYGQRLNGKDVSQTGGCVEYGKNIAYPPGTCAGNNSKTGQSCTYDTQCADNSCSWNSKDPCYCKIPDNNKCCDGLTLIYTSSRAYCGCCGDGAADKGEECNEPGLTCATGKTCNTKTCTCSGTAVKCGDGKCNQSSEVCESTTSGGTTYKKCTSADITAKRAPTGDTVSSCVSCKVPTTPTCGDGTLDTGEECEVGHTTCPTAGETCDVLTCQCSGVTPQNQCENLDRTSSQTVGLNGVEIFTVQVSSSTSSAPYSNANVRLRVSSTSNTTAVGQDNATGQSLASPVAPAGQDKVTQNWVYTFAWKATGLTNGTYDVEVSFDGGNTWDTTTACIVTFTYDSGETPTPTFLIVKSASSTCTTSTGDIINYTLRVTNLGPGTGTIDYVQDELDSLVMDTWVSNITSSKGVTGTISNGTITWTGTEAQRTFEANESATYTYRVTIPAASLDNFTTDTVGNVATVVFGDNQTRYNLTTPMNCPGDTNLPSTGIMDNTPWVLGTFAVILGMVAFKLQFGETTLFKVLDTSRNGMLSGLGLNSILADTKKARLEEVLNERSTDRRIKKHQAKRKK